MTSWHEFLTDWERESRQILSLIPPESAQSPAVVKDRGASHFRSAAPLARIEEAESILRVRLPEDLKSFYLTSNGWTLLGMGDMVLSPVECLIRGVEAPPHILREIREYLFNDRSGFIDHECYDELLLLSNSARTGFCVANPKEDGSWRIGFAEIGSPFQAFQDFTSCMKSLRWFCHYYLRSYFDYV